MKKVQRTGNICSLDNVIHTEGAAHRNIFQNGKKMPHKNEIEFKDEYVFEFFDDVRWE
jgi:hypothetical protein